MNGCLTASFMIYSLSISISNGFVAILFRGAKNKTQYSFWLTSLLGLVASQLDMHRWEVPSTAVPSINSQHQHDSKLACQTGYVVDCKGKTAATSITPFTTVSIVCIHHLTCSWEIALTTSSFTRLSTIIQLTNILSFLHLFILFFSFLNHRIISISAVIGPIDLVSCRRLISRSRSALLLLLRPTY